MRKYSIVIAGFILIAFIVVIFLLIDGPSKNATVENIPATAVVSQEPSLDVKAHESPGSLVYIALIIMSIATLISIIISFYLYKWRRILLAKPTLLVPEEWGKYLDTVGKNMERLGDSFTSNINHLASKTSESSEKIGNMTETYMSLQNTLDEKDSEIRRLKKGYDAEVFRKFVSRFIRIDQAIDYYIHLEEGDSNFLGQLKRLFEDALDECGVESFAPQIGEDYRRAFGVADNPKKIKTEDPDEEFMVAEIIESGYRLRNGNDYEIVRPCKVSIYRHEK